MEVFFFAHGIEVGSESHPWHAQSSLTRSRCNPRRWPLPASIASGA